MSRVEKLYWKNFNEKTFSNTRNSSPFESGGLRSSQMTSSTAKRSGTFYEDEPEDESNIDSDDNVFVEDSEYEDTSNGKNSFDLP